MTDLLNWFDGILLNATQKFCDKFQRLTGFTKFRLQKWAAIFMILFFWMMLIFNFTPHFSVAVFMGVVLTSLNLLYIKDTEREEAEFFTHGKLRVDSKSTSGVRSAFFLAWGAYLVGVVLSQADPVWHFFGYAISFVADMYFSSCVPRPPSKSKMREWLEKGLMGLRDLLPPVPEPAPVPNQ